MLRRWRTVLALCPLIAGCGHSVAGLSAPQDVNQVRASAVLAAHPLAGTGTAIAGEDGLQLDVGPAPGETESMIATFFDQFYYRNTGLYLAPQGQLLAIQAAGEWNPTFVFRVGTYTSAQAGLPRVGDAIKYHLDNAMVDQGQVELRSIGEPIAQPAGMAIAHAAPPPVSRTLDHGFVSEDNGSFRLVLGRPAVSGGTGLPFWEMLTLRQASGALSGGMLYAGVHGQILFGSPLDSHLYPIGHYELAPGESLALNSRFTATFSVKLVEIHDLHGAMPGRAELAIDHLPAPAADETVLGPNGPGKVFDSWGATEEPDGKGGVVSQMAVTGAHH